MFTRRLCVVALPVSLLVTGCVVGDEGDDDLLIEGGTTASLTFVQHNVEKKDAAIENAVQKAIRSGAEGIALQEVCPSQLAALRSAHGNEWTIGEAKGHKAAISGCPLPDGTQDHPSTVVIYTGGTGASVTPYDQLVASAPAGLPGEMVCVEFKRAKTPVHFCSAHLISADWTDKSTGTVYDGSTYREKQTTNIKQIARDWFGGAKNHFGVIAGDFNGKPNTSPLNKLYDAGMYAAGEGDFTEYNRSGAGRDGQPTSFSDGDLEVEGDEFARKIDYIFFSTNRAAKDGPQVVIDADASDHDMVTSTVHMRK